MIQVDGRLLATFLLPLPLERSPSYSLPRRCCVDNLVHLLLWNVRQKEAAHVLHRHRTRHQAMTLLLTVNHRNSTPIRHLRPPSLGASYRLSHFYQVFPRKSYLLTHTRWKSTKTCFRERYQPYADNSRTNRWRKKLSLLKGSNQFILPRWSTLVVLSWNGWLKCHTSAVCVKIPYSYPYISWTNIFIEKHYLYPDYSYWEPQRCWLPRTIWNSSLVGPQIQ